MAAGDLNGDGHVDLVVGSADSSQSAILSGHGDGSFDSPRWFDPGCQAYALAVGDFNDDGAMDIATAWAKGNVVTVQLGDGKGNLAPSVEYHTRASPVGLCCE